MSSDIPVIPTGAVDVLSERLSMAEVDERFAQIQAEEDTTVLARFNELDEANKVKAGSTVFWDNVILDPAEAALRSRAEAQFSERGLEGARERARRAAAYGDARATLTGVPVIDLFKQHYVAPLDQRHMPQPVSADAVTGEIPVAVKRPNLYTVAAQYQPEVDTNEHVLTRLNPVVVEVEAPTLRTKAQALGKELLRRATLRAPEKVPGKFRAWSERVAVIAATAGMVVVAGLGVMDRGLDGIPHMSDSDNSGEESAGPAPVAPPNPHDEEHINDRNNPQTETDTEDIQTPEVEDSQVLASAGMEPVVIDAQLISITTPEATPPPTIPQTPEVVPPTDVEEPEVVEEETPPTPPEEETPEPEVEPDPNPVPEIPPVEVPPIDPTEQEPPVVPAEAEILVNA